ncbi:uncharacterized protein At2g39795, mitochondrial [Ricinus communis]|uniref:Mitochondrial glycoprotein n=1 Tax=Ricinus communis TaxID=3988 RepID=B9SMU6_RICCO|nr:uncharacterized protein At2g39795, mitochondrial [Ricinus communis]EEF35067.1 conserved hypothetical protein [Ricinus communis]|eukprot:XP_002527315.1 uncharacterized protein At2g39795, mitochondrial [Ricinus communis]
MARLIRTMKRTLISTPKTLIPQLHQQLLQQNPISELKDPFQFVLTRNYISEMRKSAFQDNILRLLRNEIQYELDRAPPKQLVTKFKSFAIDERPGEQWITLKTKFAESEEIKVEATMFDGAIPGDVTKDNNVQLHITLIVNILKGDGDALEIMCSAWPNSIEITKLFIRGSVKMPDKAYVGPDFKELDDELQESLYEFLEARGIDDEMAAFLHEYMKNKGRTEYIRWIDTVKSYIEKK